METKRLGVHASKYLFIAPFILVFVAFVSLRGMPGYRFVKESLEAVPGCHTLTRCLSQLMPTRDPSPQGLAPLDHARPQMQNLSRNLELVGLVALSLGLLDLEAKPSHQHPKRSLIISRGVG